MRIPVSQTYRRVRERGRPERLVLECERLTEVPRALVLERAARALVCVMPDGQAEIWRGALDKAKKDGAFERA